MAELNDEQREILRDAQRPRGIAGFLPEGCEPPDGMYLKPGSSDLPPSGWDAWKTGRDQAEQEAAVKRSD